LEAIIIDPGEMGADILNFIEGHEYNLKAVLVTHDHKNHIRGLRTLKRIYNTEVYAINHIIADQKTNLLRDEGEFTIGPFRIEVIAVPGHSSDSAVYKIGNWLFTGDAMSAGLVGRTPSSYGAAIQIAAIRSRLLSLPGDCIVFPGHGPPSTLEAERQFNAGILFYEQTKRKRPTYNLWYD
jgi:glyoxylase-like metal-dependent hydrolase (beta-lactamase superfamily II)